MKPKYNIGDVVNILNTIGEVSAYGKISYIEEKYGEILYHINTNVSTSSWKVFEENVELRK